MSSVRHVPAEVEPRCRALLAVVTAHNRVISAEERLDAANRRAALGVSELALTEVDGAARCLALSRSMLGRALAWYACEALYLDARGA